MGRGSYAQNRSASKPKAFLFRFFYSRSLATASVAPTALITPQILLGAIPRSKVAPHLKADPRPAARRSSLIQLRTEMFSLSVLTTRQVYAVR